MSQENVEIVRSLYAFADRGDVDGALSLVRPEFVADFSRRLIDPAVLRGRDETRAFFEYERDVMWEQGSSRWEPKELIDAGDKVAALIRTGGKGKASGVEVEAFVWNVWTFRDGEPVEWKYFGDDRAAALEEAGLSQPH